MKYINNIVKLDTLTMSDNPRIPTNLRIPQLAENIVEVGKLLEPITVWSPEGNGTLEVIRGHRRTLALQHIARETPDTFKSLFPEGISVLTVEGCSPEDVIELKLDHTEQQGLTDPHEVQMSANMLFAIRKTEAEVAFQLSSLIDKISPMKAKAVEVLSELREKLSDAKKPKAKEAAEKEIKKHIADYRRGFVQHLHDVYRSPLVVNASLFFKACNLKPEGFEDVELVKVTNSQVNSLWKAHKEDLEIIDEETNVPKYNQTRTGPNFNEKWTKILEDSKKPAVDRPKTPKAMSAKDMKADIGVRFSSIGFCKLTSLHAGDKTVEGLEALDKDYHFLDLVAKEQPELLDMIRTEGAKIEAEQVAKDQEAKGTEG